VSANIAQLKREKLWNEYRQLPKQQIRRDASTVQVQASGEEVPSLLVSSFGSRKVTESNTGEKEIRSLYRTQTG
jgi:hypothetical protein